MKKEELLELIITKKHGISFRIHKLIETIRFYCTREKVLLNFWAPLCHNQVQNQNLGDELNFYIVKTLTNKSVFNLPYIYYSGENFIVIGSVVDIITNKNSVIWGAGAMYGGERILKEKPKKVLAVRGPLTRDYLLSQGVDCPEIYGDPALLLPTIYQPNVTKKYRLGVIPHYIDFDSNYLSLLREDSEVKIIRLRGYQDWKHVINEICECEFIVSSSLHGLIISDAYNIPNKWIKLSGRIMGGDFKYMDYFMSVKRKDQQPIIVQDALTKEFLLQFKELYAPIEWTPEKLLSVSPF